MKCSECGATPRCDHCGKLLYTEEESDWNYIRERLLKLEEKVKKLRMGSGVKD